MSHRPSRTLASLSLVALAGLGLSACGGSSTSPTSTPVASSTSSSAASSSSTSSSDSSTSTSSTSSSAPASSTSTSAASAEAAVTIKDFKYTIPASVAPGTKITVTNMDSEAHTFTASKAGIDVKVDGRGGTATFTAPSTAGSYDVTCDYHSNMHGTLVVS